MNPTILQFELTTTENPMQLVSRYGKLALNRTEWKGRPPLSCALRGGTYTSERPGLLTIDVEYRPKGCNAFVGRTKYQQWSAMMVNRAQDGTLIDGKGKPLPEGAQPVYIPINVYPAIDFNDLDFGKLISETEVASVKHTTVEELESRYSPGAMHTAHIFLAPRRSRLARKIVICDTPSGRALDGFGTDIVLLSHSEPQLDSLIEKELTDLICEFIEGRAGIIRSFVISPDEVYVDLSDTLVDVTGTKDGLGTFFDVLNSYVPVDFMDNLAKQLMSIYEVEVEVLDGKKPGLFIKRVRAKK